VRGLLGAGWAPHPDYLVVCFFLDLLVFSLHFLNQIEWMNWVVVLEHGCYFQLNRVLLHELEKLILLPVI